MGSLLSNLFKNSGKDKGQETPCKENGNCLKYLQLIIDGEASEDQKKEFATHIEECMPCYKKYDLEKTIKDVVKSKCSNKEVPAELIETIKTKIREQA
jgi:anti-sigma factor (TIGR02949 family)